jgi:hypothetical protein
MSPIPHGEEARQRRLEPCGPDLAIRGCLKTEQGGRGRQGSGCGKYRSGAPGTIRTSDPQIRSLMLYPAELRARVSLSSRAERPVAVSTKFCGKRPRKRALLPAPGRIGKVRNGRRSRLKKRAPRELSPRPLVAHAQEFDRPVRYRDAERGPNGAFNQVDLPAMGANQFGGNHKPEPAAAGPARGLERLE